MSETIIFLKMLEKGISADTLWHSWGWADNTISQLVTKASQELLFSYFCCASKCVLINTASIIPPNPSQVWSLFFILLPPTEFTMWKWLFAVTSHFVAEISKKLLQTNVALRSRPGWTREMPQHQRKYGIFFFFLTCREQARCVWMRSG